MIIVIWKALDLWTERVEAAYIIARASASQAAIRLKIPDDGHGGSRQRQIMALRLHGQTLPSHSTKAVAARTT